MPDIAAPTAPGQPSLSNQADTSVTLTWEGSTDDVGVTSYQIFQDGIQVSPPLTKIADPATLPPSSLNAVAWSADGSYLAVASDSSPYVTVYSRSGSTLTKLSNPATLPPDTANGVAWTSDGSYLAVVHQSFPYVTVYSRSGSTLTKISDPATLPPGDANGVAWTADGSYLAVAHDSSPYLTVYSRSGDTLTKISNPATLPVGTGLSVAWTSDGSYLAVGHLSSPRLTVYSRSGDTLTKLTNPTTLPGTIGYGVACTADGSYFAVASSSSPYLTVYSRSGSTLTKIANPAILPPGTSRGVACTVDGSYFAVAHSNSPYVTVYSRLGDTFTKIADPSTLPNTIAYGASFTADGSYLAVAHGNTPFVTNYNLRTNALTGNIAGLTLGTPYSFTVKALDAAGNTSSASIARLYTPGADITPPSAPAAPTITTYSDRTVNLGWAAVTDAVSYRTYMDGVLQSTGSNNSSNVLNVPDGTHTFTVSAADVADNWSAQGPESTLSNYDRTPPDTPVAPSVSIADAPSRVVTISWPASGPLYAFYVNDVHNTYWDSTTKQHTADPDGTYSYSYKTQDAAGNWSELSPSTSIDVDRTPISDPTTIVISGVDQAPGSVMDSIYKYVPPVWTVASGYWRTGSPEYELTSISGRTINLRLDGADTTSFTLNGDASDSHLITELQDDVWWRRNGELIHRGRLIKSTDNIGASYDISMETAGYEELLDRRFLRSQPYQANSNFPDWKPIDIVEWLIKHAESQVGMKLGLTFASDWSDLGIQSYEDSMTLPGSYVVEDGEPIYSEIRTMQSLEPTFDFWIDPLLKCHVKLMRGEERGVVLDYGGVIQTFSRSFDSEMYNNVLRYMGEGGAPIYFPYGPNIVRLQALIGTANEALRVLKIAQVELMKSSHDGDANIATLRANMQTAREELEAEIVAHNLDLDAALPQQLGAVPYDTHTLEPVIINGFESTPAIVRTTHGAGSYTDIPEGGWADTRSGSEGSLVQGTAAGLAAYESTKKMQYTYNVTFVGGSWKGPSHVWIGDWVRFVAHRGRVSINEKMRVVGLSISIDEVGTETVTATLNYPKDGLIALKRFRDRVRKLQRAVKRTN